MKQLLITFIFVAGLSPVAFSQTKNERAAAVQAAVSQQLYVFRAQTALPVGGRSRQLTTYYSFTVIKDSVISDLPYFGRAYSAPLDPTQSALQFSSGQFSYNVKSGKKGGWDIDLTFKDVREVERVSLSISKDGYGTLQVFPTNRQTISFTGSVEKKQG